MRARTFAALMVALLFAWPIAAQEQRGSIEGVVKDSSGAVLPGVTVEARSSAGAVLSSTTDTEGVYRFPSVAPGTYEITATLQGFTPKKQARRQRRPRTDQEGRPGARAGGRRRIGAGHGRVAARRRQAERAADEHLARADRSAPEGPRLHDARHAGARAPTRKPSSAACRSTARAPARTATSSTASRPRTSSRASRARTSLPTSSRRSRSSRAATPRSSAAPPAASST